MKINLWPLDGDITTKEITYKNAGTDFCVDIKFQEEDKIYHIAEQFIDVYDWDENSDKENIYHVNYSGVEFNVDTIELSHKEITDVLVNFLARYKLYLHHFRITGRKTYVSYKSPETKSNKLFDLSYEPAYRQDSISITANVQLEDNTDYCKLLDIKTKEPFKTISGKKLKELGYKFSENGIYSFTILSDEDARKYLNQN